MARSRLTGVTTAPSTITHNAAYMICAPITCVLTAAAAMQAQVRRNMRWGFAIGPWNA